MRRRLKHAADAAFRNQQQKHQTTVKWSQWSDLLLVQQEASTEKTSNYLFALTSKASKSL